jgi:uncharacterized 2Fe-2S/4Fe-4S cluster protein (DUF4445 family)
VPVVASGKPATIKLQSRKKMAAFTIEFEPVGRRGECPKNESLLACARQLGVGINSICGGEGVCHSCKVQVVSGTVSKPTSNEREAFTSQELKKGWRLACQTYPGSDCKIAVPAESMTTPQRVQAEGLEVKVAPETSLRVYHLKLSAPSLEDPQADADRLLEALNQQHKLRCTRINIGGLRTISEQLRSWKWKGQAVVRNDEVIAIQSRKDRQLGLAIDLGTTKVAGYLVDLSNGRTLAAKGMMNPQISYGEDIISRITTAVHSSDNAAELQKLAVDAINELCTDLCAEAGAKSEEILEAVVVGNTAMHHLFLRLPAKQLAISPFVPAINRALEVRAGELGLNIAPGGYVYLLPNIAGFVGSDHVSILLATDSWQAKEPTVALDIGTNTEVSLVYKGKIVTTSCASGPAFEGGHIKYGMRAAAGAVERLRIDGEKIQYQTIDGKPPVGICGSGILDALAQLYISNIIDAGGRIMDKQHRVRSYKGQREFILVSKEERKGKPAITITQHDVRELQLAKAAIRTGIQVLLERSGCAEDDIKQVIIAGAFGTYIDISSAVAIGMLPSLPIKRFRQVGNAAGMGAKMALLSLKSREQAEDIASRVRYIELGSAPEFEQVFIQANYLGQYRIIDGKREAID